MKFKACVLAAVAAAALGSCGQTEITQVEVVADPPPRTSGGVFEGETYLLILVGVVVIGGFIAVRRKE